jgi:hypothetical protein
VPTCDLVGIDPDYLRQRLAAWMETRRGLAREARRALYRRTNGCRISMSPPTSAQHCLRLAYSFLQNPAFKVVSGFFGPIERIARSSGARASYLAADFNGLERLAARLNPRVTLAAVL